MISAFTNCLKIPELRKKILFTLGIMALCRVAANIPCPGIDPEALERARKRLARFAGRSFLLHASFRDLGAALLQAGLSQVDGVLLDLGVSSRQIDAPERGFRFSDESAEHTPLEAATNLPFGPLRSPHQNRH